MAKLVLSADGAVLQQYFIGEERLVIGRGGENAVVLEGPAVSREHAAILSVGNDQIIEDLDSSNGTFVNGARVVRKLLQHGDVIEIGTFQLRYLNPRSAAEDDLERTMLAALPGNVGAGESGDTAVPGFEAAVAVTMATRPVKTRFPKASVMVTDGPRPRGSIELNRVVAVFGEADGQTAVINRRPHGYFIIHVKGRRHPRVNGKPAGREPVALRHGDVIEVAEDKLTFLLE